MPDLKVTDDSPQRVGFFDELNSPNTPAYTLPRVAGTSGQVITIDANGDCNFQSTGSVGSSGAIEFRALPYYDNVNAAASNWSPSGKTITPEVYFNLSQVSYNGVKTNNTWRYDLTTGLTFTGGNEDTGVSKPALGFSTHTDGVTNPNVTGNFIYTDAVGTEHTFSFRIDWLLIQEGAAGSDGAAGTAARGVILTASDQSIEYNKDGTTPNPATVTVFAEAVNASQSQDVYFEFFEDDVSKGAPTAAGDDSPFAAQITLTSASTIGSPKKIECQIREGSASNAILARDQIVIFPLKQGSDGITIILSNEAHTLPTTNTGTITFTGSGTDIEVYEGTTQLSYDDSAPFANSSFRVTATPTSVTLGTATTVGNLRRFPDHTAMSADNASVEFSIIVKSDEGVERTFIKKQSLSKSVQGAEGSAGSDGRTVTLTSDKQLFDYDTNGANPTPSSATITATARNTTGTVYYEFFENDSTVQGPATGNTYTYTPQADIANMPEKIECEIREGAVDGTIVARDQFTTFGLQPGSSAITIAMSNEAHTIKTGPLGDSPSVDYPNSGTNFRVFEGNNQLGYDESGSPAVSTYKVTASASNITAGSASTTGGNTRVFAAHSSMTANDALITFTVTVKRADGTTSDFTRTQTLSKSITGEPAKTVRLTAADYVIEYDQDGLTPDPSSTIALTGTAQGFVDPYFKFTGDGISDETSYTNGTSGTDADTFSFSVPSTYTSTPKTLRVGVAEASAATTEIAFDSITIASVKEGSGNVMAFLTNDSHVFPANSSGAVTDFTGSGTNIEVFEGATQLDYDASGTTAGHFTVTTDGGTNITPGAISDSGNVAVVADASTGVATGVNTSKIVFTISGKRGNGDAFSITKNQTFSKSTAGGTGGTGATGATGSRTVKGILYYEYATEAGTCDSGNTTTMTHAIRAADWSDDEYNTGFEIVNLTQSSGTLNADITDVNGTTGVITHASMADWNDGVDQYVIRPLPDQDGNAEYDFTETGDSALSGVASNWSVEPPEVELSKSYQRYWEVEFSATETGVTGTGSISFGTPVPSIRFGVNIQSDNFQTGLKGWRIQRDSGDAEFNNVIARGSLRGGKVGPRDHIAYNSPCDDSPLPFSETGGSAAGKSVTSGFYIGPDDSPFDSPYTGSSGGSYDLIIGDATHQLRFDGSKGRLDLKGVANLGVDGTFEAKANSSLPNTVIYDFANEGTSGSNETNVSVRMYNGTLDAAANNSRVAHIVTRTADGGVGAGNTDGRYEIKDANDGEMTGGAFLTFDEIVLRADDSNTLRFVHFEADGDAYFHNKVGIGRSPTGSYKLDVNGDINFTGSLTQNGSTYGGGSGSGTVTGTGNQNKISKWSGTSALTDSLVSDDGTTVSIAANDFTVDTDTLFVDASADRVGINDSTPSYSLDVNGTGRFTTSLTIGAALEIKDWSSSDSDIDGLISGSAFGQIIEGDANGHLVVGIRGNDTTDSFSIISGGGNYNTDSTYDLVVAQFSADGKVGIGQESGSQDLEVKGAIKGAAGANSGDAFYIGNDSKLVDINVANIGALYGTSTTTEGGLKLGSGGPTLYGKSSNLGIGTTSPTVPLQVDSTAGAGILIRNDTPSNTSPILEVRGQRSDANNSSVCAGGVALTRFATSDQIIDSNDIGSIYFGAGHGASSAPEADILLTASICAEADETFSDANNMATDLVFRTGSTGRAYDYNLNYGDSEVMRITHEAYVGIGTSTPTYKLDINDDAATGAGLRVTGGGAGAAIARFERDVGSTGCFVDISCSSGDPQIRFTESSGVDWAIGVEGNVFEIVDGNSLTGSSKFEVDSSGNATAANSLGATGGTITAGFPDTTSGLLYIYGGATGGEGGEMRLYNNADDDSTYDYWRVDSDGSGQFRIGRAGTTDFGINLSGQIYDMPQLIQKLDITVAGTSNGSTGLEINSTGTNFESDTGMIEVTHAGSGTPTGGFFCKFNHGGTTKFSVKGTGDVETTGDVTAFVSDERLKTRVDTIDNAVEKVRSLNGFIYKFNDTAKDLGYDSEKRQVGLSAQEVEKVLPEVIKPAPVDNKYKTLDYAKVVPLLVEAIKEQQEQIENLQKKLEEMSK